MLVIRKIVLGKDGQKMDKYNYQEEVDIPVGILFNIKVVFLGIRFSKLRPYLMKLYYV